MPARIPIGVPTAVADSTKISEPTILHQPSVLGVGRRRRFGERRCIDPLHAENQNIHKIQINHTSPKAIAMRESASATRLISFGVDAAAVDSRYRNLNWKGTHVLCPLRRICISNNLDKESTTNVMKNKISPR